MLVMRHNKLLPVCLTCLLLSLSIVSVRAQDPPGIAGQSISPEKQALIRELLELADSKKTIEAMFKAEADQMDKELPESIWKIVSGMIDLQSLTTEQREELRLKVISSSLGPGKRAFELIQKEIDFNKLIEDISFPLYEKYFTESELRDLLAFYKSPTGKKVIEAMPHLLSESMQQTVDVVMPKVSRVMTQIQSEETERIFKEILASVKTKAKPAKPARRTPQKRPRH